MINQEKVKLNSTLLVFENGKGRDSLKLQAGYDSKGIRRSRAVNAFCGAFSYLCILAIVYCGAGYRILDFGSSMFVSALLIAAAAAIGVVFVVFYCSVTEELLKRQYTDVRNSLGRYYLTKRKYNRLVREIKAADNTSEE